MSVMLRCKCGFEVTIPDEAAGGIVSCPACHQEIDPAVSVIHPRLDDLDPELLLAPDDDEPAPAPVAAPRQALPTAPISPLPELSNDSNKADDPLDDLSMLIDVDEVAVDDADLSFLSDEPKSIASPQPAAVDDSPADSSIGVPNLDSAIVAPLDDGSLLSSPAPVIVPPSDDDEGYAVIEEDYSKPTATSNWQEEADEPESPPAAKLATGASAKRVVPDDDDDEIMIAEEAPVAKPKKPAAKPKPTGPRDALDDLLDDDINIPAAPVAAKPVAAAVTACPGCQSPLDAGAVLCVNCGYNLKLGKKMDGSPAVGGAGGAAEASPLLAAMASRGGSAKSGLASKLNWSDPRVKIGVAGGAVAVLLGLVGFFLFGGGGSQPSTAGTGTPATGAPTGTAPPSGTAPVASPGGEMPPEYQTPTPPAATPADTSGPTLRLVPQGINGKVFSIDLADDNLLLAIGDESGNATLFDLEKGEPKQTIATGITGGVNVDLDPSAARLVTGFAGGAKLWNAADGKEERSFKTPVDGAWQAQFINNGNAMFTSGPTGLLSIVDLSAGGRTSSVKLNLPAQIQPVLAITSDGKTGIIGSEDGILAVWDLAAGRPKGLLPGHTTKIAAVALSADGSQALSAAGGAEYRLVGKERWLASNRPIDFNVRLWDVAAGRELLRLPLPPDKPCTSLAFSPDGKLAAVVAGDVRIIDLANRKLLATISPSAPGSTSAADGSAPPMPTEPFRLAKFFGDGVRLVTTGQTSGLHIWELPSEPKLQDLPGLTEPADLASYQPAADAQVSPLELPPAAPATDEDATGGNLANVNPPGVGGANVDAAAALAARQAASVKAAEVSAKKDKGVAAFRKALAAQPTTVDRLWQLAEICYKNNLMLEAEECLRGLLLAQPSHEKALKVYRQLGKSQPKNVGPVTPVRAWAEMLDNLDDAGQQPDPPRNGQYVSIPIEVAVVGKGTKIDASSVSGKAGDKEATFLGIYHRPTGEVTGAKKGNTTTGQAQVWEAMAVSEDRDGKTIVQLLNRRMPQAEQPRPNQPAGSSSSPKIKMVSDGSRVKEDYAGPYNAIFVVPQGETLTEISWEETQPVYLLGEEPTSLEEVATDKNATTAERLAAIKALGAAASPIATTTLDLVIAEGDDKLFAAARDALRQVRRQAGLIDPEFLPVAKPEDSRLYAITQGKMDSSGLSNLGSHSSGGGGAAGENIVPVNQYSYCKMVWRIPQAGKYRVRIASFGPSPDFQKQQSLEFEFTAADANWYVVTAKLDREVEFDAQLVELWQGPTLQERRFLARNPWDTSALAARLKLDGVDLSAEGEAGANPPGGGNDPFAAGRFNPGYGNAGQTVAKVDPFADVTQVNADARPLFGKPASQLPTVERAVLEELLHGLPEANRGAVPAIVVDIARLDTPVAAARDAALERLKQSLGEAAPAVFARLAEVAYGPAALAAIESLRQLGGDSALACRTLIDLQTGPPEIKQAAEQAVADLMTQGVIVQRGTNWLYHGETHFPEQASDGEQPEAGPAE